MLRPAFHLTTNVISLVRYLSRRVVRNIPGLRGNKRRYVRLDLPAGLALTDPRGGLRPLRFGRAQHGAWWVFDQLLARIAADPWVEGVYYRINPSKIGFADAEVITLRLDRLRAAGKRVVCYLEQGMVRDYILATPADTIMMAPPGRLYTFGLRLEMVFLADALKRAGILAQFVNLGRFKTAAHRFTRHGSTPAQEMMMGHLLHGIGDAITARIATRRQVDHATALAIFDDAPISAREARRRRLIDHVVYADQVIETLESEGDCDRKIVLHTASEYERLGTPRFRWRPLSSPKSQIAVLNLKGIIMHDGVRTPMRNVVTPKPLTRIFEDLGSDPRVKAVVLRIDSPGGSALGSDIIWRQLQKLSDKKPVIASLGNVAASGGYYIAVAADEIVAQATSITGSIGVIAGKLSGGELLDKIGIKVKGLQLGETAAYGSITQAMGDREMANLKRDIRAFYRRFLQRVAHGRGIPTRRLHRLARGRVYTGVRAHKLGLVDHLGDLDRAIDIACEKVGLARDAAVVTFVDHRPSPLRRLLGRGANTAEVAATVASELIPEPLQVPAAIALLLREPATLALMPTLPVSTGGA